ncbi:MAG: GNAT family N-acetyltransferase [Chlamydiales bacterium]|nr:GNAT family N-acetyltransferase [Chlamydiales bacterium]
MKSSIIIKEEKESYNLNSFIINGFKEHSIEHKKYDGNIESLCFCAFEENELIGAAIAKTFWGALHIKNLYLKKAHRGQKIGKALIDKLCEKGKKLDCSFAYLETFNFQALDFYNHLGFKEEFVRHGYDKNSSFHYLKKEL